jgi:hypothetical protein
LTGVAHLSSALFLKGRFPRAPLHLLVLAAAAPDLIWAAMNLVPNPGRAPLEVARIDRPFIYIGSLDLVLEPFSHALFSVGVVGALLAGLGYLAFRDRQVVLAVLLAVAGHWLLDYLVHDADLLLTPFGDRARVGPGLALDALHPHRGLNATAPLVGFALQTLVVAGSAAAFLHAFPPVGVRRPRLWFTVGLGTLVLMSLPVFIQGALTGMTRSTQTFVVAALAEKALAWLVIAFLASRVAGEALVASPFRAREDEVARRFALNLHQTLAAPVPAAGGGVPVAERLGRPGPARCGLVVAAAGRGLRAHGRGPAAPERLDVVADHVAGAGRRTAGARVVAVRQPGGGAGGAGTGAGRTDDLSGAQPAPTGRAAVMGERRSAR